MIKYIFLSCFIVIFLGGCSNNLFVTKERDARNSFNVPPLVIPPNVSNMNLVENTKLDNDCYVEAVVFQLLFNEELDSYNKKNSNLPFTLNDIAFLRMFNKGTDCSHIRDDLNKEYLFITTKNKKFLNKILNWQVIESVNNSSNEYKNLNNIN